MKIKQIFAVLAVSASLMSCNFLDEFDPNATTAGNFYTSEADIETSLNGVYQSLAQSYYYQYNYYFTDVRAHVTVVTDSGASSGIPYQFYNYTLTEEEPVRLQPLYAAVQKHFASQYAAFPPRRRDLFRLRGARHLRGRSAFRPCADLFPSGHGVGGRAAGAGTSGFEGRGGGQQLPSPQSADLQGDLR